MTAANEVVDFQLIKQRKEIVVRKPAIGCEPNAVGLDGLKNQFESAFDDGPFIAFHAPFER
jgi:hypothetical protein